VLEEFVLLDGAFEDPGDFEDGERSFHYEREAR
jgi:hypothetical protein